MDELAISRSTSGFMAIAPCVKKLRWRSTIACEMVEIKSGMHEGEPAVRRAKKLEPLVSQAVQACTEFLARLEPGGKVPDRCVFESPNRGPFACDHEL